MRGLSLFYSTRCPDCGGYRSLPVLAAAGDDFKDICNDIAKQLYDAQISLGTIPRALYEKTAAELMDAIEKGMGGASFKFGDPNNTLRAYLQENAFAFSGAKSLTEMQLFGSLMFDENGVKKSFNQYLKDVSDAGLVFNKTYLETEWNTAEATATEAANFQQFEDDEPLQYSTAHDNRVRPWHAILDGTTFYKSDPIASKIWPPLDWNCRCHVVPGVASKVEKHNVTSLVKEARIPKYFQRNPGITKMVFDKGHPYYKYSKGDVKEMTAEKVYGMPPVKKLYADFNFPKPEAISSKEEANTWWKEQAGQLRGSFDQVDNIGNTIRFDNDFRKHIMEDNKEDRWRLLPNIPEMVKSPDEVWTVRTGDKLERYYVKYFDRFPYVLGVNEDARAFTFYEASKDGEINEGSLIKTRRGVLLFRKN
jgi:SPP1 gp7 family putative phage head morphogenesis protein